VRSIPAQEHDGNKGFACEQAPQLFFDFRPAKGMIIGARSQNVLKVLFAKMEVMSMF
jgi:hypothetical protein